MSVVLQLIVNTSRVSKPGMPSRRGPFPSTTKNLHNVCLFLELIVTSQMPNCGIIVLLYVSSTFSFFVALENNILKIWTAIIFPSIPVLVLYGITSLILLHNVFNFCHYY